MIIFSRVDLLPENLDAKAVIIDRITGSFMKNNNPITKYGMKSGGILNDKKYIVRLIIGQTPTIITIKNDSSILTEELNKKIKVEIYDKDAKAIIKTLE